MRIIRSVSQEEKSILIGDIPFVPAYDLLEAQESSLSDEEAAAIAVALLELTSARDASAKSRQWSATARVEAISQTTLKE